MEQKNKGGRPTKAEMAARGITKTELDAGLKILKKIFGNAIDTMIELSDNADLSVKDRFKMKQDLVNMYITLVKSDQALKMQLTKGTDSIEEDPEDRPLAPVFNFGKK